MGSVRAGPGAADLPIYKRHIKQVNAKARDFMNSPPVLVSEDSRIEHAADLMWENRFGSVIIVDKNGMLAGIVTERDIIFAVTKSMIGKNASVSKIMSRNTITVGPDESIAAAIDRMREANVRHLPVMGKDGRPIGMISIRDVVDAGASLLKIMLQLE
jgi:CBS domain-containing protein